MQFTAVIEKSQSGWFVGQIEEVPAVLSQGRTLEELKENLADALQLVFEANRESIQANYLGKTVFKELVVLPQ